MKNLRHASLPHQTAMTSKLEHRSNVDSASRWLALPCDFSCCALVSLSAEKPRSDRDVWAESEKSEKLFSSFPSLSSFRYFRRVAGWKCSGRGEARVYKRSTQKNDFQMSKRKEKKNQEKIYVSRTSFSLLFCAFQPISSPVDSFFPSQILTENFNNFLKLALGLHRK